MENTINLKAIANCLPAVSKEKIRYNLQGVLVEDRDGYRHYAATNGYILIHAYEKMNKGDVLEKPLIIKPLNKVGKIKTVDYGILHMVDNSTAVIKHPECKILCEIIDGGFPDYCRVIPKDRVIAKEYASFNPALFEYVIKLLGNATYRPYMADSNSPALWEKEIDNVCYDLVLMPIRVS